MPRTLQELSNESPCKHCRKPRFLFKNFIVLGEYQAELRHLLLRMKTDRTGFLAGSMATLLLRYRKEMLLGAACDVIVPVPIHRKRRFQRGVNSPDFLAEQIGRTLRIPVWKKLLIRTKETDLQFLLSVRARRENVRDAFSVRASDCRGKNFLLVDDILTTGATCNEITKELLNREAQSVCVCALAKARGTGSVAQTHRTK